jgi:transposase-like protein
MSNEIYSFLTAGEVSELARALDVVSERLPHVSVRLGREFALVDARTRAPLVGADGVELRYASTSGLLCAVGAMADRPRGVAP